MAGPSPYRPVARTEAALLKALKVWRVGDDVLVRDGCLILLATTVRGGDEFPTPESYASHTRAHRTKFYDLLGTYKSHDGSRKPFRRDRVTRRGAARAGCGGDPPYTAPYHRVVARVKELFAEGKGGVFA